MRDDVHLVDQEEHESAALAHRPVDLARLRDDDLGLLGDRHLLGDLERRRLCLLKRLDQLLVLREVALGLGEHLQQPVPKLLQLDRESVLLRDELGALLTQVGSFGGDDHCEQLLLEALLGHGEVDDRRLRLDLGDVVRVGQLRLQVELEERTTQRHARLRVLLAEHVDLFVAQLDDQLSPLGDRRACKHWVHDSVERLTHLLEQHRQTLLHRLREQAEVVACRLLAREQPVGRLALPDPVDALKLWVDDERVARAACDDGGVLEREPVRRQPLRLPDRLRRYVGEQQERVELVRARDLSAAQVGNPRRLPQSVAELGVEGA